ncbi:hypothetical protein ES708_01552 [subsurface metagenome]
MGFWLWQTFLSQRKFTNNQCTDVFNLPRKGVISNLMIETYMLSGSQKVEIMSQDALKLVEVIGNGSTVLQSLTGQQLQASMAYDDHQISPDKEYVPSGGCYAYFDIRFGRYVGDPLYALDCSKWNSLELKITFDIEAGGSADTTGYTDDSGKLQIYGLYSPDGTGLAPVGYLKKAQKKTYTTTVGGTEDLALPNDYPFRRLLLLSASKPSAMNGAFQYITIDINTGARKPIDNMLTESWMFLELAMRGFPMWLHSAEYYLDAGVNSIVSRIGFPKTASVFKGSGTLFGTAVDVHQVRVDAEGGSGRVNVWGVCPDRALAIDLERWSGGKHGVEAMMDTFGYDQTADIHFKHTQLTAGYDTSVMLEQYATPPAMV